MPDSLLLETRVTDPSQLTTRQILREVSLLEDKLVTRMLAEEKSIDKLFSQIEKVPDIIDHSLVQINAVHAEKFNSIQTQFRERDTRAEQTSKDSKTAVDAALQAAKEAVGEQNKSSALAISKSEIAVTKQIDQIYTLIAAANKTTDEKINDLKSRLDQNVGQEVGVKAVKDDGKSWIAIGISLVGLLVMIAVELFTKVR
jgi:cation transport regulator ChaB